MTKALKLTPEIDDFEIEALPPLSERERIFAAANAAIMQMAMDDAPLEVTPENATIARSIFSDGRAATSAELSIPGVVLQLQALLEQYDYDMLQDANQIRNYVVNRLVEESKDAMKASDRLTALKLLGQISEVGLFTERRELVVTHRSTSELQEQLRETFEVLLADDDVTVERQTPTKTQDLVARARTADLSAVLGG